MLATRKEEEKKTGGLVFGRRRDERRTGGDDVQKETTEGDEENAVGERERTVGHARVVGEEVREMSNSFFYFLSRARAQTKYADEEEIRTQPIRDEHDGDTRFSYLTVLTEA